MIQKETPTDGADWSSLLGLCRVCSSGEEIFANNLKISREFFGCQTKSNLPFQATLLPLFNHILSS